MWYFPLCFSHPCRKALAMVEEKQHSTLKQHWLNAVWLHEWSSTEPKHSQLMNCSMKRAPLSDHCNYLCCPQNRNISIKETWSYYWCKTWLYHLVSLHFQNAYWSMWMTAYREMLRSQCALLKGDYFMAVCINKQVLLQAAINWFGWVWHLINNQGTWIFGFFSFLKGKHEYNQHINRKPLEC